MKSFEHIDARTVDEAVGLLKENKSKLMAGGTDLLGVLKERVLPDYPELLVNIKSISGLDGIEQDEEGLKIGALARLADVAAAPAVKEAFPMLAEAAQSVAIPQIRNMATIGGNLTQDNRCWYYRYPHEIGGRIMCYLKGGQGCYALNGENQYHSIFGGWRNAGTPCTAACPGGVDIPSYLSKVREGDLNGAADILLEANPLPAITGRVCPHFCEGKCNRGDVDEAVSVRDIERFLGDHILENGIGPKPEKATGKKVAVVGSGPAGLSAAVYLAKAGHAVTVFEALPEAGGMLRVSIPEYRLPQAVLNKQIEHIRRAAIDIKTGTKVESLDSLLGQGYDAVFVAVGAHRGTRLGIAGEDSAGVTEGLSFLTAVKTGEKVGVGDRVAVIGGGEVAIDSARTARRLGAKEVTLVYRRTRAEMPAAAETVQAAVDEGVRFAFLTNPVGISAGATSRLKMTCVRMELGEPDASGRPRPVAVQGSEFPAEYDSIIAAIGQNPDIPAGFGLKAGGGNTIETDDNGLAAGKQNVWAGGDAVSGPATVIEAMAAGKKAADAINLYLGGDGKGPEEPSVQPFLTFDPEYLRETGRVKAPETPAGERRLDAEDGGGLSPEEVAGEANRCYNCSCLAVNSSDIGLALVALDAGITVAGPAGGRNVPAAEFFGTLGNSLGAGEMVTGIRVPRPPAGARQVFLKHRVRAAVDFAIVGVAAVITEKDGKCTDARIVLGSVAPAPLRAVAAEQAMIGRSLDSAAAGEAGVAAVAGAIPLGRNKYKVEVVKALVKRALTIR